VHHRQHQPAPSEQRRAELDAAVARRSMPRTACAVEDLAADALFGAVADDRVVLASIHPRRGDSRLGIGEVIHNLLTTNGILRRRRRDDHYKQNPNTSVAM
jgi:hypothetical protein